ncbi:MAG: DUF1624 domain-containing protein [Coriobacteriaceae bacterium]|nr:DUF1624 domain-containing protein [Coriobacteriaceae bacterium]
MPAPSPGDAEHGGSAGANPAVQRRRIGIFDAVRGLSVISMVLFHLCYDLRFLAGADLAWFAPPLQDVWRASISWTFLFVAGCMCPLSRSNLRRGFGYGAVAVAIYLATALAAVDVPISFGIIYCMSACTLVAWALERLRCMPTGPVLAGALFVCFVLLLGLPSGTVGIGPLSLALPRSLYEVPGLAWLGVPGPGFSSGDYYPLVPFVLMYLTGASMGSWLRERGYPGRFWDAQVPVLNFVGRHALLVYVVHQPVLLLLTGVA